MDMKLVNSSNIHAIGYDSEKHVLHVEFVSGSLYEYDKISEELFRQMEITPSVGKFFHSYIKNRYPFKKLR